MVCHQQLAGRVSPQTESAVMSCLVRPLSCTSCLSIVSDFFQATNSEHIVSRLILVPRRGQHAIGGVMPDEGDRKFVLPQGTQDALT